MKTDLLSLFEKKLLLSGLIKPGDKVFVACSGGPDSVALVHLLSELRGPWKLKLGVLHFHHGLRARTASRDMNFVTSLAKSLKIPCAAGRGNVRKRALSEKLSVEEAARKARYEFFSREASKRRIAKIAFAHTRDDQAETVLMRMIQGTGLQGLQAIREKRGLGKALLVRPLLSFSKAEIINYLSSAKKSFCKDETNDSSDFLRNRLRKKVLPLLEKHFNPRVKEALARIPAVVSEEAQALESWEREAFKTVCLQGSSRQIAFSRPLFKKLPPAIQFRVLRRALEKLDPRSGLPFDAWETLRGCLARPRYRHSLKRDLDLSLTPEKIMVYRKKSSR